MRQTLYIFGLYPSFAPNFLKNWLRSLSKYGQIFEKSQEFGAQKIKKTKGFGAQNLKNPAHKVRRLSPLKKFLKLSKTQRVWRTRFPKIPDKYGLKSVLFYQQKAKKSIVGGGYASFFSLFFQDFGVFQKSNFLSILKSAVFYTS